MIPYLSERIRVVKAEAKNIPVEILLVQAWAIYIYIRVHCISVIVSIQQRTIVGSLSVKKPQPSYHETVRMTLSMIPPRTLQFDLRLASSHGTSVS
jgi:hypothetical protein